MANIFVSKKFLKHWDEILLQLGLYKITFGEYFYPKNLLFFVIEQKHF